jgi:mono/diheme cytochrome c family protein
MRKLFKWIGITLGGLLGLLVLAAIVFYFVGGAKLSKKYDVPVQTVSVPTDAEAVQRGEHLATILICKSCHGDDLSGKVEFEIPGMLTIPTPNLTSGAGGVGSFYTDDDWERAIRHGVGPDGRALFIMISKSYHNLGDQDLGALIAYLKGLPAVNHNLPERRVELMGKLMMGAGLLPPFAAHQIDHASPAPAQTEPSVTVAYGEYLSQTCMECHGENLNGAPFGPPGEEIMTPNLTPGGELAFWSEQEFFTAMRTGQTPDGRQLKEDMPWKYYGQMTDEELQAIWLYLQSLPKLEQAN